MYAAKKPCAYFFRMPDLSSETNAVITQASAWMAWTCIQQELWQQRRKGSEASKVAAELNRLHCGIRQLASHAGCTPGTMRRQCRRLARAGLIRIIEEVPQLVQHPVTGRLVSRKAKGPIKPVVIVVELRPEHLKPANAEEAKARRLAGKEAKARRLAGKAWVQPEPTQSTIEVKSEPTIEVKSEPTSESSIEFLKEEPTNGIGDGVAMPSSAASEEEEGAGHSAGKCSREEGELPALEAIADPDTASEPSWTYAQGKESRSLQPATDEAKRSWTPKPFRQATGDPWKKPEGSMPVGESFGSRRFYRADSQISQTDAEHDVWRQERRAAAQKAASELAASAAAIRPTRAERAASGCRQAATAGV